MALLAALNLKEPKNWAGRNAALAGGKTSAEGAEPTAQADRLKAELGDSMKKAIALATKLPDPGAKSKLALALKDIDAERKLADASRDTGSRIEAYRATLAKLNAAVAVANQTAAPVNGSAGQVERIEKEIEGATKGEERRDDLPELDAQRKRIDDRLKALGDKKTPADATAAGPQLDLHDSALEKSQNPFRVKTTRVTQDAADGTSTTQTSVDTSDVGLTGLADSHGKTREVVRPDGTKTTDSKKTSSLVGPGGLGYEAVDKTETEGKDGKKHGSEDKTAFKANADGVTRTDTTTDTHEDGSSETRSKETGVERGDGKFGKVDTRTSGQTDAAGTSKTTTTTTKTGVSAGKDGSIGVYGDQETKFENKRASGFTTGAVAGLKGNISCNVVAVGGEPPRYEVRLSVQLGARASLSAGREKEGGRISGGIGVSGSQNVSLDRVRVLSESETHAYLASLKAASSSGSDASRREFEIISLGVTKGWPMALDLHLGKDAVNADAANELEVGESIKTAKNRTVGANANANATGAGIGVGLEGGYEHSENDSRKVTKEKDGKLAYELQEGDADRFTGGAKLNVGPASLGLSKSRTYTTSTGYKFSVDPKNADAAAMQALLDKCQSQKELDAFAKKYPKAVKEMTKGEGQADGTGASLDAGPVGGSIGFGTHNSEAVTVDGDGNFLRRTITGGNSGSDELKVGKYKIGSSSVEEAVAQIDADGNASLDTGKTDKSTNAAKWLDANVPVLGSKGDKGVLAAAGGEAEDTDDQTITGTDLSGPALSYLGKLASGDESKWLAACDDGDQMADWLAVRSRIRKAGGDKAAVAREMAAFVGKDNKRAQVIEAAASNAGVGARYEFPGSLASIRDSFTALVTAPAERQLDSTAKNDGNAAAITKGEEMISTLNGLETAVKSAQHGATFTRPDVQAAMVAAIVARREKVRAKLRVLKGGKADELSSKEIDEKYSDLAELCLGHQQIEEQCFAKIEKTHKGGSPNSSEVYENAVTLKQLTDLHALWKKDYAKLAACAQETGRGKDRYWKLKPDTKRLQRALDGEKPGAPTEFEPETKDFRKKPPVKEEPRDPVGDEERKLAENQEADWQRFARHLAASRKEANETGNRLAAWIQVEMKRSAVTAHNRGREHLAEAKKEVNGPIIPPEMATKGVFATEWYRKATIEFKKGLALYPRGMPKKPQAA